MGEKMSNELTALIKRWRSEVLVSSDFHADELEAIVDKMCDLAMNCEEGGNEVFGKICTVHKFGHEFGKFPKVDSNEN